MEEPRMKTTGIVRRIDHLGRVVIPKEMCRVLHIQAGDPIEFNLQNRTILLTRHEDGCLFCGEAKDLICYKGRMVCHACIEEMQHQDL